MRRHPVPLPLLALAVLCTVQGACIPYTVGSTARTVAPGDNIQTVSWFAIPNAVEVAGDSVTRPVIGIDAEVRRGIDERSDVGIRFPSSSGIVVTYKRRLDAAAGAHRPAVAAMAGMGLVNWGEHAHFELTLIASGREDRSVTPYGGARIMQVAPLSEGAVHDAPTAGGFFGLRFGRRDFGVSPEVGIYHDPSALGMRSNHVIVVPSISVHGEELLRLIGGILDAAGRARASRIPDLE